MNNIEVSHLTKRYKNGVIALDDISFTVGSGVFGLLGHNGAGKTTLMKALVTVLEPTAGSIQVCGFDTKKHGGEVRSRIGYLPQELAMYPCRFPALAVVARPNLKFSQKFQIGGT